MDPRARHWIAGQRCASALGSTFDTAAPVGGRFVGRWPRAGESDLAQAMAAANHAAQGWSMVGANVRQVYLTQAVQAVELESATAAHLEALSGVAASVRAAHWHAARELLLVQLSSRFDEALPAQAPLQVLAPPWSADLAGYVRALLQTLSCGQTVVLLTDPRLPALGDALWAFAAALPAGVLNILHGLEPRLAPAEAWHYGTAAILRVRAGTDLVAQAQAMVHAVYDLPSGACGWRAGQPACALIDDEVYGAFSQAVLQAFEQHPDRQRPFALATAALAASGVGDHLANPVQGMLRTALEDGAVLIPPRVGPHYGRVLVNISPRSQLLEQPAVGPILRLARHF